MYIQNKPASALYKMFIGILAAVGFWLSLAEFGLSAWRLFSTSILLVAALYFLISALIIALSKKRNSGQIPCPMLEGALIVSSSLLCVATIIYHLQDIAFPGAGGWHASLIYFVLPFLVLSDWLLFTKKGQWHLGYPLYWMAPAIIYASLIILTAFDLPETDPLRYPVAFLDFYNGDLITTLEWIALVGILMLVYGYVLILIDCTASGKISQHIVLPRIKTIVLEEDPVEESSAPTEPIAPAEPPIERIEVKLEPMEQPPRRNSKSKAKPTQPRTRTRNTDGIKPNGANNKSRSKSASKPTGRNNPAKKKPAPAKSSSAKPTSTTSRATAGSTPKSRPTLSTEPTKPAESTKPSED